MNRCIAKLNLAEDGTADTMKDFNKMLTVSLAAVLMVFLFFASCNLEDPYALWKQQPNEKIVYTSKADSSERELYLLDKSAKITRLTNNKYSNGVLEWGRTKLSNFEWGRTKLTC